MTMISEQFPNLLTEGLRAVFWVEYDRMMQNSPVAQLFNVAGSSKAQEEMQGVGNLGDWDLIDDDQYNVMNQRVRILAQSAARKREKDAASVFNNAFSSSYTGGDSVSLCNDSHPLSPTHSSDVQANAGSSALSYDAVTATITAGQGLVDDRNELLPINYDTILVPSALGEKTNALVKTANQMDTSDYHANAYGNLKVIVWPYLTDANNWFMIDSNMAKLHLHWFNRVPLEFAEDPTSDYNLAVKMRGYMRYSYGWSDYRWLYGHSV